MASNDGGSTSMDSPKNKSSSQADDTRGSNSEEEMGDEEETKPKIIDTSKIEGKQEKKEEVKKASDDDDETLDDSYWMYDEGEMEEEEEMEEASTIKSGVKSEGSQKIPYGSPSFLPNAEERERQWFTKTLSNYTQITSGSIQNPFHVKLKTVKGKKFSHCFKEEKEYPNLKTEFSIVFGTKQTKEEEEEIEIPWHKRYILPNEVLLHDNENDCWVSWHGVVRNLTPITRSDPEAAVVILADAGKDISHWFNIAGHLKQFTEDSTWLRKDYLPRGDIPGLDEPLPWWRDPRFNVGRLSHNPRTIKITNTLTSKTVTLEVAGEEKINDILKRYLPFNSNAEAYTWTYEGQELDMEKNLADNGISDDSGRYAKAGVPALTYIPTIMLKYNDFIA